MTAPTPGAPASAPREVAIANRHPRLRFSRRAVTRAIATLDAARPDILALAGFMRIVTPAFVQHYAGRMMNIHPSLLPKYPGLHTHKRALEAGDTAAGCTVHEVTADLDAGPILGQTRVPILPGDTADTLAARVLVQEHRLYPAILRHFAERT